MRIYNTINNKPHASFKPADFEKINQTIGKDGLVTADDLRHFYDSNRDKNKNDQLGPAESFGMCPKAILKEVLDYSYEFPTEQKRK